jgi:hypothetical protein
MREICPTTSPRACRLTVCAKIPSFSQFHTCALLGWLRSHSNILLSWHAGWIFLLYICHRSFANSYSQSLTRLSVCLSIVIFLNVLHASTKWRKPRLTPCRSPPLHRLAVHCVPTCLPDKHTDPSQLLHERVHMCLQHAPTRLRKALFPHYERVLRVGFNTVASTIYPTAKFVSSINGWLM